jgi:transcriptional regulator with XRE-family HTH domain
LLLNYLHGSFSNVESSLAPLPATREKEVKNHVQLPSTDETVKALNIGPKIRRLRKQKALTLQNLSTATGLSKPLLSQIENEIVVPPIATLLKISRALDKDIAFFFQDTNTDTKITLVRASERGNLDTRKLGGAEIGYHYEALAYKKNRKNMEPFFVEFKTSDEKDMPFYRHDGEEFIFVLQGRLEFRTKEEVHRLKAGDSLYFESDVPHAYRSLGNRNATAVVVLFSPPGTPM